MSSVDSTLIERGKRYGEFEHNAETAQLLKAVLRAANGHGWSAMETDQRQALDIICDKVARIVCGDPDYVDNWHDIGGYARLVETRLLLDAAT